MAVGRLKKDRITTSGNTAARPSNPEIGDTHYNGQLGQLEIYNGTSWTAVSAPPLAPTIATPTNASGSDVYSSTGGKLSVVFTRNAAGGEPVQYNAYTTEGGFSASSSSSTVTITGLTPGTSYVVYGNVQNNFGTSTNSANTSAATPSTRPQAPTIGTAAAANASATLTFTAGNTGGSAITNYKYSIDGTTYTAFSPAQTTSPLTISGLTNGTSYAFYLKAVNANGDSTASGQSNSVSPIADFTVDYLIVAGGGGGGAYRGGGGGAGGLRSTVTATGGGGSLDSALTLLPATNYAVVVGAGGAGGLEATNSRGTSGQNSSFNSLTSTGGGGGGSGAVPAGLTGGSAGGSASDSGNIPNAGGTRTASPVQGNNGGGATNHGGRYGAGGGGGAGAAGTAGTSSDSGAGGNGVAVSITGSSVTYAGGGGGGDFGGNDGTTLGGTGGGGDSGGASDGNPGTANTGGGGGGGSAFNDIYTKNGGAGGSGVVILRYIDSLTITIGAGLTGTESAASGGYKRTTLTAGSGNVSW